MERPEDLYLWSPDQQFPSFTKFNILPCLSTHNPSLRVRRSDTSWINFSLKLNLCRWNQLPCGTSNFSTCPKNKVWRYFTSMKDSTLSWWSLALTRSCHSPLSVEPLPLKRCQSTVSGMDTFQAPGAFACQRCSRAFPTGAAPTITYRRLSRCFCVT